MDTTDKLKLIAFYEESLARYGPGVRALHWSSPESQRVRFEVLCQVGPLEGASIADIGCGLGDLYGYLGKVARDFTYVGYDLSPSMIAAARVRYPAAAFQVRDILEQGLGQAFDYVLASGTFNIRIKDHDRFLQEMITRMYEGCLQAVAFNLLTPQAYPGLADDLFYSANPQEVLRHCQSLCHQVVLRQGYMASDFTIAMVKRQQ